MSKPGRLRRLLAATALLGLAGCSSPGVAKDVASAPATARQAASEDFNVLWEVMFVHSRDLGRSWELHRDRKGIRFTSYERLPGGVVETAQDIQVEFSIRDVAPRGGNEVFIGADPARGGFVIERWTFPDVTGALTAGIPTTGTGIGVPVSPTRGLVYTPGGIHLPLEARPAELPPVHRLQVAEDPRQGYRAIGADPEGRFLLVLTDDDELRQYPLADGSGQPLEYVVIADPSTAPQLESVEGLLHCIQHAQFGRLWMLFWSDLRGFTGEPGDVPRNGTLILTDSQNDGVFELIASHPYDSAALAPYDDRTQWLDDYRSIP